MQVPLADPGSTEIRVDRVTPQDPSLAGAANDRRFQAATLVQKLSSSLLDSRQKAEEEDFIASQTTASELDKTQRFSEMQEQMRMNPDGASARYLEYMNQDIETRVKTAPTTESGNRLRNHLAGQMATYGTRAVTWENNTKVNLLGEKLEANIELSKELGARAGNLSDAGRIYEDKLSSIDAMREYMPEEKLVVLRDKLKNNVYGSALEAIVLSNPNRALQEIQSGAWNDYLNPIQLGRAQEIASNKIETQFGLRKRELSDKAEAALIQDEQFGTQNALPLVHEIEEVYGTDHANRYALQAGLANKSFQFRDKAKNMTQAELNDAEQVLKNEAANSTPGDNFKQKNSNYHDFLQAKKAVEEYRAKDPVGAAYAGLGSARAAPQDVINWQKNKEIPETQIGVLPKESAKAIVADFNAQGDVQQKMKKIDELRNQYGPFYKYVMNDLAREGINKQYYTMGWMNPVEDAEQRRLAARVIDAKGDDIRGLVDSAAAKTAAEEVSNTLRTFFSTTQTSNLGVDTWAPTVELTKKMAWQIMAEENVEPSIAAQKATSYVTNSYTLVEQGGGAVDNWAEYTKNKPPLRLPKVLGNGRQLNADAAIATSEKVREFVKQNPDKIFNNTNMGGVPVVSDVVPLEKGNIDLTNRPVVDNPEGGKSTVYSTSFEMDGKEILVPRVTDDGKIISDEQAIEQYKKTGKHLGIFKNANEATAYAQALHEQQSAQYPETSKTEILDENGLPATLEDTNADVYNTLSDNKWRESVGKDSYWAITPDETQLKLYYGGNKVQLVGKDGRPEDVSVDLNSVHLSALLTGKNTMGQSVNEAIGSGDISQISAAWSKIQSKKQKTMEDVFLLQKLKKAMPDGPTKTKKATPGQVSALPGGMEQ